MILLYIIIAVFIFLAGYAAGCKYNNYSGLLTEESGDFDSAESTEGGGEAVKAAGETAPDADEISPIELENAFTLLLGYNKDVAYGVKKT